MGTKRLDTKPHHIMMKPRARSIQPKFQPVRPGKEDHLKRWTRLFETFPVGPNRSIEIWTEISGNFGWMDRAPHHITTSRNHEATSHNDHIRKLWLSVCFFVLISKVTGIWTFSGRFLYISRSSFISKLVYQRFEGLRKKHESLCKTHFLGQNIPPRE